MALFLAALMLLAQTAGQSGQAAKAAIEGVVQHTATNAPIAGARVTLMRFIRVSNEFGGAEPASSAVTDAQGHFQFPDLPEGAYALQVVLDGYIFLTETYLPPAGDQRASHIAFVALTGGRSITDIVFRATPVGTIAGRIVNAAGQPVAGIAVEAFKNTYDATGGRSFSSSGSATTNERGEFRVSVMPGRGYYVLARDSRTMNVAERYGGTLYPGVTDLASATPSDLNSGATVLLKDLVVGPQRLYAIRGRVIDVETGRPPPGASVWITTTALLGGETITTMPAYDPANGTFETRVGIGSYALGASVPYRPEPPPAAGAPMLMPPTTAESLVTITNANVGDVVLRVVRPAVSIRGRLSLDRQPITSLPGWENIRVLLARSRNGVPLASTSPPPPPNLLVAPDGTFQVFGSMLGEFRLSVTGLPGDAFVQVARFGGTDALQQPLRILQTSSDLLDIVVNSAGGRIEGTVVTTDAAALARVQVVVVPDQRDRHDLFRAAAVDRDGRVTIRGLAPGGYSAFALSGLASFEYFDPAVLARAERAGAGVKVRVTEASVNKVEVSIVKLQ